MKQAQAAWSLAGVYLFSSMAAVLSLPAWQFGTHPAFGSIVTIAWGAACVAQGVATCAVAGVAALFILIVGSFRSQSTGQRGGPILPISNRASDRQVWHDLGNGEVKNFLDTSALEAGVKHTVWDSEGNVFTATRHAKTGDNVLTIHLGAVTEDTPTGRRVVTRSERLGARQTNTEVDSFAGSWSYSGTAYDDYTQDDANTDATKIVYDLFGGENREELLAPYDCSTLTAPNGDDEKANISITPQGPGLSSEIEPACGA